ncbi:hypothetical protein WICPIJ_000504 [Wickerhamomyces pijperi]|uniref:Uncharacterized protein n=1 Tax=Wickerhamomyces pijperi TaxID=599730 RepID=A0A9P8QGJ2_WICPI|nr:hypothetical protein WICPIJ_000504 [Wickerhamomyces pijperi]
MFSLKDQYLLVSVLAGIKVPATTGSLELGYTLCGPNGKLGQTDLRQKVDDEIVSGRVNPSFENTLLVGFRELAGVLGDTLQMVQDWVLGG